MASVIPWIVILALLLTTPLRGEEGGKPSRAFNPETDIISLHYDHAPDRDDGHSAAADRTILESLYGHEWFTTHCLAVSGAYGKNKDRFVKESDRVMDAVFGNKNWFAAHEEWDNVTTGLATLWMMALKADGDVWVKEGGQSDLTCAVLKLIHETEPDMDTRKHVHVVQHSVWNEKQTHEEALEYTKAHTDYIKIRDANAYLNVKGGNATFEKAALSHPVFGPSWKAAFEYYDPRKRLDFSDTGELLHLLGLGEMGIEALRERFLDKPTQ
ncbi:MAG: hypothetical protein GC164_11900 [Phycisphaera sp.]|nr:hypothetical protein [Phycisphaera sp.]